MLYIFILLHILKFCVMAIQIHHEVGNYILTTNSWFEMNINDCPTMDLFSMNDMVSISSFAIPILYITGSTVRGPYATYNEQLHLIEKNETSNVVRIDYNNMYDGSKGHWNLVYSYNDKNDYGKFIESFYYEESIDTFPMEESYLNILYVNMDRSDFAVFYCRKSLDSQVLGRILLLSTKSSVTTGDTLIQINERAANMGIDIVQYFKRMYFSCDIK